MFMTGVLVLLVLGLSAPLSLMVPATAQTDEQVNQALNNVQHEASTCIAYYTIVQVCIEKDDPDLGEKLAETRKYLIDFAMKVGDTVGMTNDAMVSRVLIEQQRMQSLVRKDCVNISSLLARHAYRCKQVVENGDSVLLEYLETD
jgi:hypothetical protein